MRLNDAAGVFIESLYHTQSQRRLIGITLIHSVRAHPAYAQYTFNAGHSIPYLYFMAFFYSITVSTVILLPTLLVFTLPIFFHCTQCDRGRSLGEAKSVKAIGLRHTIAITPVSELTYSDTYCSVESCVIQQETN